LVQELTLLRIRGTKMCLTITSNPLQAPLHKGIQFATFCNNEMVVRLGML
jgi:hypothetical protein